MAKVGGSYDSVVLGVSQQTPQDRRSGQMWEQVNMVSDPVQGLTRRQGSIFQAKQDLKAGTINTNLLKNAAVKFKVRPFSIKGVDYDLIYSNEYVREGASEILPVYCYDKTNKKFLKVKGGGPVWGAVANSGATAVVNIGEYLFISANGYIPKYSTTNKHVSDSARKSIAIWVRNGDYSRDYQFRFTTTAGTTYLAAVKTPSSSYPGKLDTSGIPVPVVNTPPASDPDFSNKLNKALADFNSAMAAYNKKVADATNGYNSAVTQWLGTSSAAIQPEAIAIALTDQIRSLAGLTSAQVQRDGSYIFITEGANIRTGECVSVADTYLKAVVNDVSKTEDLIPKHFYGKVVKVRSQKATGKDSYYLVAEAKDGMGGIYGDVIWRETAGVQTTPTSVFCVGTVVGDTLFIGSDPASLESLAGISGVPRFVGSQVGDQISIPVPNFLKKGITYMGVFQDRLLIGTGSTVFASRPGDYFNWFRQSVLSVSDNDPVEMYALGSEDDTIYWDTSFDRNHVMFGRKYQYIISGRSLLTPNNPNIQIMSAVEDAVQAEPQASGNLVFYGKDIVRKGSLHQMQVGATTDSAESYECSQQLDRYIRGKPCQILCNQSPFVVLLRTTEQYTGFYVYTYLDSMQGGQRMFDSWSTWMWDEALGYCAGISKYQGEILCYTLRTNPTWTGMVCDRFTFDTELSDYPYLDSWRPMQSWVANKQDLLPQYFQKKLSVAYTSGHNYYFMGSPYENLDNNMPGWETDVASLNIGVNFPAFFTPTSPYLRDKNEKAILNGRLTISRINVSVSDTGALEGTLELGDREVPLPGFGGRILTRRGNYVGRQPIVETSVIMPVYKEIREYKLKLMAKDWLPLTVTGVEWVGQWFSRVKRV